MLHVSRQTCRKIHDVVLRNLVDRKLLLLPQNRINELERHYVTIVAFEGYACLWLYVHVMRDYAYSEQKLTENLQRTIPALSQS